MIKKLQNYALIYLIVLCLTSFMSRDIRTQYVFNAHAITYFQPIQLNYSDSVYIPDSMFMIPQTFTKNIHKETKYAKVKKKLVKSVDEYINTNFPKSKLSGEAIVNVCERYDFDICFALAQAEIESHLGTVGLAARTNSPWNVCAYDGKNVSQIAKYGGKYSHPNHSIEPYIKLVKDQYLGDHKTINDLMRKYVNLNGKRYASNPNYEKKLLQKYRSIRNDTKINNLQNILYAMA